MSAYAPKAFALAKASSKQACETCGRLRYSGQRRRKAACIQPQA